MPGPVGGHLSSCLSTSRPSERAKASEILCALEVGHTTLAFELAERALSRNKKNSSSPSYLIQSVHALAVSRHQSPWHGLQLALSILARTTSNNGDTTSSALDEQSARILSRVAEDAGQYSLARAILTPPPLECLMREAAWLASRKGDREEARARLEACWKEAQSAALKSSKGADDAALFSIATCQYYHYKSSAKKMEGDSGASSSSLRVAIACIQKIRKRLQTATPEMSTRVLRLESELLLEMGEYAKCEEVLDAYVKQVHPAICDWDLCLTLKTDIFTSANASKAVAATGACGSYQPPSLEAFCEQIESFTLAGHCSSVTIARCASREVAHNLKQRAQMHKGTEGSDTIRNAMAKLKTCLTTQSESTWWLFKLDLLSRLLNEAECSASLPIPSSLLACITDLKGGGECDGATSLVQCLAHELMAPLQQECGSTDISIELVFRSMRMHLHHCMPYPDIMHNIRDAVEARISADDTRQLTPTAILVSNSLPFSAAHIAVYLKHAACSPFFPKEGRRQTSGLWALVFLSRRLADDDQFTSLGCASSTLSHIIYDLLRWESLAPPGDGGDPEILFMRFLVEAALASGTQLKETWHQMKVRDVQQISLGPIYFKPLKDALFLDELERATRDHCKRTWETRKYMMEKVYEAGCLGDTEMIDECQSVLRGIRQSPFTQLSLMTNTWLSIVNSKAPDLPSFLAHARFQLEPLIYHNAGKQLPVLVPSDLHDAVFGRHEGDAWLPHHLTPFLERYLPLGGASAPLEEPRSEGKPLNGNSVVSRPSEKDLIRLRLLLATAASTSCPQQTTAQLPPLTGACPNLRSILEAVTTPDRDTNSSYSRIISALEESCHSVEQRASSLSSGENAGSLGVLIQQRPLLIRGISDALDLVTMAALHLASTASHKSKKKGELHSFIGSLMTELQTLMIISVPTPDLLSSFSESGGPHVESVLQFYEKKTMMFGNFPPLAREEFLKKVWGRERQALADSVEEALKVLARHKQRLK